MNQDFAPRLISVLRLVGALLLGMAVAGCPSTGASSADAGNGVDDAGDPTASAPDSGSRGSKSWTQADSESSSFLYMFGAASATVSKTGKGNIIQLDGVDRHVLEFTDRPLRFAMEVPTVNFMRDWGKNFDGDPPNAGISGKLPDGTRFEGVGTLRGPLYDPETSVGQFHIRMLATENGGVPDENDQLPDSLTDVVLLIDDGGDVSSGSDTSPPTQSAILPWNNNGMDYGVGLETLDFNLKGGTGNQSCLLHTVPPDSVTGGVSEVYYYTLVTQSSELATSLGLSAGAKLSGDAFTGEASANFVQTQTAVANTTYIVATGEIAGPEVTFDVSWNDPVGAVPWAEGTSSCNPAKDPNVYGWPTLYQHCYSRFFNACGNLYMSSANLGARFYGVLKIVSSSSDAKAELATKLGASMGEQFGARGDLKASLSTSLKDESYQVFVLSSGAYIDPSSAKDIDSMFALMSTFFTNFKNDCVLGTGDGGSMKAANTCHDSAKFTSYVTLNDGVDQSAIVLSAASALSNINALTNSWNALFSAAQEAQGNPDQFSETADYISGLIATCNQNLGQLAAASSSCYTDLVGCAVPANVVDPSTRTDIHWPARVKSISNLVIMLAGGRSCPSDEGLVELTAMRGRYLRGACPNDSCEQGGAAQHTHSQKLQNWENTTFPPLTSKPSGWGVNTSDHSSHVAQMSAADTQPSYQTVTFCSRNVDMGVNLGANALFMLSPGRGMVCPVGSTPYTKMLGRFPLGKSAVDEQGGSDTHTHSQSIRELYLNFGTTVGTAQYRFHSMSSASSLPPFVNMLFCENNGDETRLKDYPQGAVILIDGMSCPNGYLRFTELDGKFPRGETVSGTGGSATHTHSQSVDAIASAPLGHAWEVGNKTSSTAATVWADNTASIDSASSIPQFYSLLLCQKQ